MKRLLMLICLMTMVGCIQQLSNNIRQSNELMEENLQAMQASKAAIEENTHQIKRSTETMQQFQFIFPIFFGLVVIVLVYFGFKFSNKIIRYFRK